MKTAVIVNIFVVCYQVLKDSLFLDKMSAPTSADACLSIVHSLMCHRKVCGTTSCSGSFGSCDIVAL